jgi:hypothetical protein
MRPRKWKANAKEASAKRLVKAQKRGNVNAK